MKQEGHPEIPGNNFSQETVAWILIISSCLSQLGPQPPRRQYNMTQYGHHNTNTALLLACPSRVPHVSNMDTMGRESILENHAS